MPRHVRKGDTVMVTAGNEKGRTGVITRVIPEKDKVIVQGVNLRTKHMRPTQVNPQGGVIRREEPIHISNVSPVVDGKPTRVRFESLKDGRKVRVAARGGKELGVIRGPWEAPLMPTTTPAATPSTDADDDAGETAAPAAKKKTKKKAAKKSASKKKTASASKKKTKKKTSKKTTKKA